MTHDTNIARRAIAWAKGSKTLGTYEEGFDALPGWQDWCDNGISVNEWEALLFPLPQTMTVFGREYRLIADSSPPHWCDAVFRVSLIGYDGMWRAQAEASGDGATVLTNGSGQTPETALLALTVAYGAIETQRVRMVELVEGACGMRQERAA